MTIWDTLERASKGARCVVFCAAKYTAKELSSPRGFFDLLMDLENARMYAIADGNREWIAKGKHSFRVDGEVIL
jgi:hypothetical protein